MFTRFKWPESVFFLTPQMAQIRFFYDACQTLFNKTISLALQILLLQSGIVSR